MTMTQQVVPHESSPAPAATLDLDVVNRRTAELVARNVWSHEKLIQFQHGQLRKMLQHAVSASPYYRDLVGDLVAQNAPLHEFPVMTKAMLMANFDRIVTDQRVTRALVEQHLNSDQMGAALLGEYRVAATGGTTGERGIFIYDQAGWEIVVANLRRFQRLIGILPTTRIIGIGAPSPIHLTNRLYAKRRSGQSGAPCLAVTMPIAEVVAALNAYQPEVLSTYPSFLRRLTEEQGPSRLQIAPRLIRSVAETLTRDVRELVRAVWNVPVINVYAATEIGVLGQECEQSTGMHLAEDLFVMEVVDQENRPVPAGVLGAKVLVTPLTNYVLPVIRYELSDLVTMADGPCRCGSPLALIADIQGRREETLQVPTASGACVDVHAGRLRSPLLHIAGIRQYQFAQLRDGVRIRIVPAVGCDSAEICAATERAIRNALAPLGAETARVDVEIVDQINRTGSGAKETLVAKREGLVPQEASP
jgi:phenylacetate-CoA ligase